MRGAGGVIVAFLGSVIVDVGGAARFGIPEVCGDCMVLSFAPLLALLLFPHAASASVSATAADRTIPFIAISPSGVPENAIIVAPHAAIANR